MKKIILGTLLASSLAFAPSFAIYDPDAPETSCAAGQMCIMTLEATSSLAPIMQESYDTSEAFLQSEGQICETASDGVNMYRISDGELGPSTKIGYPEGFAAEWICTEYLNSDMMNWSINDRNHFNTLLKDTPEDQKEKVEKTVMKVQNFLSGKTMSMQEKYHDAILELIDTLKMEIVLNYPQDTALPQEVSQIYNMLTLLRFTLMTL